MRPQRLTFQSAPTMNTGTYDRMRSAANMPTRAVVADLSAVVDAVATASPPRSIAASLEARRLGGGLEDRRVLGFWVGGEERPDGLGGVDVGGGGADDPLGHGTVAAGPAVAAALDLQELDSRVAFQPGATGDGAGD